MPQFRAPGVSPWNVTLLAASGSPATIQNPDGSAATRFGGIFCDTIQTTTINVNDTTPTAVLTANKIFSTINQAANTLAAPPSGGCELNNGLIINYAGALAGSVYAYWK